jgi:hypothetical protein
VSFRRWWVVAFLAGLAAGLLWWGVTDTATWSVTKDGPVMTDDNVRRQFGVIVNFVFIGAGVSLLLGFAVAFFSDVHWPAVPLVALMAGQASVLAWGVGRVLGPDVPKRLGPVGSRGHAALTVDSPAPFFAWAVFAVAGLLLGMWLFRHESQESEALADHH